MHVKCINCGFICKKNGKTSGGNQRWYCNNCKSSFIRTVDNSAKQLKIFHNWLFSKQTQKEMPGEGRTFRRKSSVFWNIWPMPPKIEEQRNVVFVDGIYLSRKACILICCDEKHVLGWYLCRYEHSKAWEALVSRIRAPILVVSDGGTGFKKALKKVWPKAKHQRCTFHAFCQVKKYTTSRPKTLAGFELYTLAKDLLHIESKDQAIIWITRLTNWKIKHKEFLSEMTRDESGALRPTHERLLKAEYSLVRLVKTNTLFTYLESPWAEERNFPSTNNRIEGAVNAQLRAMLRAHRGLSIERRIKAVFWWCYLHSPKPLSASEILKVMPTDKSIAKLYSDMSTKAQLEASIPTWGDAILWGDLHNYDSLPDNYWD